ncbi:hypothetical protein HanXRQr2_Chr12g0522001 [Helianthus annuus]|uniref:Uncharacterized protein n=1 Tax=Helianthus annuus TaxID=4232 RepID=A0A9K3ELX6_HELAN|nr:hypothetical protein HanXRQr2_Chr12g0522001 [Helianthus annuus]KAJ0861120.1 hypothetical protein HanPSC8_Chr12g0503131 [Helianthus annuus]
MTCHPIYSAHCDLSPDPPILPGLILTIMFGTINGVIGTPSRLKHFHGETSNWFNYKRLGPRKVETS